MKFSNIVELRHTEEYRRKVCFNSFSKAKLFSKKLLSDGYEIQKVQIEVHLSQAGGNQPNVKVIGDDIIYVNFIYNAYEKHDKELLLRLLVEFEDNIII